MNYLISDDRRFSYSHMQTDHPNSNKFESHCHNDYELLFVCKGNGKYVVEGAEYPLKPNTIMLFRPHEYHYVCPDSSSVYERYVINFSREILPPTVSDLSILHDDSKIKHGIFFSSDSVSPLIRGEYESADRICDSLREHKKNYDAYCAVVTATLTRVLLLLSLSSLPNEINYEENIITRVTEHLNTHATEDISLDKLAQQFFVSKYYLCHAFRQQNGTSILAYITAKRIVLAQQLIKNGEPATSVAQRTGFQNYSSFYRAYMKQTGHSPTSVSKKGIKAIPHNSDGAITPSEISSNKPN